MFIDTPEFFYLFFKFKNKEVKAFWMFVVAKQQICKTYDDYKNWRWLYKDSLHLFSNFLTCPFLKSKFDTLKKALTFYPFE